MMPYCELEWVILDDMYTEDINIDDDMGEGGLLEGEGIESEH